MATNEMKGTQAFQDTIQAYLDRKAENDATAATLGSPSAISKINRSFTIAEIPTDLRHLIQPGFLKIFGRHRHLWELTHTTIRRIFRNFAF